MKTRRTVPSILCLTVLCLSSPVYAARLSTEYLADHGVQAGPANEVLPVSGALLHLQIHDVLSVLEGVEEILVAGIPEKVAPPDVQNLLQTEHPLLTVLGMQTLQQPLSPESLEQSTGIDSRGAVGVTLYVGDPRRMFILSLPSQTRDPLVRVLNGLLEPQQVEAISLGGHQATEIVTRKIPFLSTLYLVSSEDTVYLCGDRSLVQSLYHAPTAQRFAQDSFMSRTLRTDTPPKQISLVLNPTTIQPLALQLQHLAEFAKFLIPQQRASLMKKIPQEARDQMEMQFRTQLGVQDLDQVADYAECILLATLEQVVDFVSGRMLAFEGFSVSASLKDGFIELNTGLYSGRFATEACAAPLPMDQVKEALAWLGSDYQSFTVSGKKPQTQPSPIFSAWAKAVQKQCQAKGLEWPGLSRMITMLDALKPIPTVESQAPWLISTKAPLYPAPPLADAASLEDYLYDLELPIHRSIKLMPDQEPHFLTQCFQAETEALNTNRQLHQDFANTLQKQRPWCLQENRFDTTSLPNGVTRYTRASVWTSRSGLFGYDQHQLVNRKIIYARHLGDYLVYHRGAKASPWLADLEAGESRRLAPAVLDLLERVPAGANYLSVQRVLQGLPECINGIAALESRLHADIQAYLKEAQTALDGSADLAAAKHAIRGMKMPFIIGSVGIHPETNEVYALLPSGEMPLMLPRPKLIPVLQTLVTDYAAQADELGGSLVYRKVDAGSCQFTILQSTAALTTLTRTVGNALAENYLASQEKRQELQRRVWTQGDGDVTSFDGIVARNPQWAFIPQPKPKVPAKPGRQIPERAPETDKRQIDLSAHYNSALDETWHKGSLSDNSLRDLPRGSQTLDEVTFDIRGIIQLSGREAERQLSVKFPQEVTNISVQQKGQKLHFLHCCGWSSPQGTQIGTYVVHYDNGETRQIPIVYGVDVRDWWMAQEESATSEAKVVWTGKNHARADSPPIGVCKTTWENPLSDVTIEKIDFQSSMQNSAPFLIAITIE